ncbi:RsmB/NOP family class I SAM-dependent RNA methyltransferase [Agilicoccus flavus]|uniref:RsmB/NOP family class I SAM-dependent RNA methyltransferase n=1 Tax=Agilicoccus flavus TaxID=2775968 RepID=UPI001CF6BDD3|nr:RsmB/NOP family class I SAM-dependent RNA methyltransferase [Agilicoccus flavus]
MSHDDDRHDRRDGPHRRDDRGRPDRRGPAGRPERGDRTDPAQRGTSRAPGSGRVGHGGRPRHADPARRSAQRPSERARGGDPARRAAYTVMRAVAGGAYTNLELPTHLRHEGLTGRDAAFATELVYGATRMRGFYDQLIAKCAGRDLAAIDPAALDVLRLGAHQLLGMRVAPHAAVGETVSLARAEIGSGVGGFVNAVLRRISEKDADTWRGLLTRGLDEVEALAVLTSHPTWVVRALRQALLGHGASTPETVDADLRALLDADNAAPLVSLVARPGLARVDELVDAGATASTLSPLGAVLASGGDPGAIEAVRRGRAAVQDEGSQLIPLALVAAGEPAADERWLDLCAGPGGKVALLAAASLDRGAVVFANEISVARTDLVRRAVAAALDAGAQVMIGTGDGRTVGAEEPDAFDRVLLDAPCTGLGALRRRPEARWRRTPDDVGALTRLQGELFDSAARATAPGGWLAYATCSPHLAETRFLLADALERHPDLEAVDARPLFRDAAGEQIGDLGPGPYVQLWPHVHGTDAMFLALLRKRA